jgi:hypothetical protein
MMIRSVTQSRIRKRLERRSVSAGVAWRWKPHSCRWFWAAFCIGLRVWRQGLGRLVGNAHRVGRVNRRGNVLGFEAPLCHAPPLPCKRGRAPPLPAPLVPRSAVATALKKTEFGHPALIQSCSRRPWLGVAPASGSSFGDSDRHFFF